MQLCIRGHDLPEKGTQGLINGLAGYGIDGLQLVCYKVYDDIAYEAGAVTPEKAQVIGDALKASGHTVPMIGAYFNCVHSNPAVVERGKKVFGDYLKNGSLLGSRVVGSETGSRNDDAWTYHPLNRTEESLQKVIATFSELCDVAQDYGMTVGMEGAAGHVCWNVQTLAKAQKIMSRKNTAVIFDLVNYLEKSNQGNYLSVLEEGLDTFAGRIHLFHMKDCLFSNETGPREVGIGAGEMDLKAVLKRIKAYDKNATLVLEGTTGDLIAPAVSFIRNTWEEV